MQIERKPIGKVGNSEKKKNKGEKNFSSQLLADIRGTTVRISAHSPPSAHADFFFFAVMQHQHL